MASKSAAMRVAYSCRRDQGGCGAPAGQPCMTASGRISSSVHADRWDQYLGREPSGQGRNARIGRHRMRRAQVTVDIETTGKQIQNTITMLTGAIQVAINGGTAAITDSTGKHVAYVVPPELLGHEPDRCCCKNCPWDGNHG